MPNARLNLARRDPVYFARHILGIRLTPYQKAILKELMAGYKLPYKRRIVYMPYRSGRGYSLSVMKLWNEYRNLLDAGNKKAHTNKR